MPMPVSNMLFSFKIYISYLVFFLYVLHCFCFTIDELKSVNYEVDILQLPVKRGEEQTVPIIHVTSIFGQEYQCALPEVEDEEVSEKVAYNEKSADINDLLKPMYTGNCLLKAKGWWTYEVCWGQYIKQFHIEDGQIIGQVLTLGHYESDYDWNNETNQEKLKHMKQRYHSQYYVNGTKCDLTGQPRTAEVRIFCEEDSGDYIHRVDEPGTCSYIISVHTSRVCSHPQLKPLPSKKLHTIPCQPVLNEEQYSKYLEKVKEEKELADQKRSQWLNNQQERLKVMKNENLHQAETKEYKELKEFYKYLTEDKQEDLKNDETSAKTNEKFNDQPLKTPLEPKSEETKEKGNKEPEEIIYTEEYEKELKKLESLLSPEKFAVVKKNIEEFYESITTAGEDDTLLDGTDQDIDAPYLKFFKLLKKLDKVEKDIIAAKKNLDKAKSLNEDSESKTSDNSESNLEVKNNKKDMNDDDEDKENDVKAESLVNDEEDNDLKVRIRRLDQIHSSGKVYEIDQIQQKKLERAIKERLEKYGVNTGGRRIEVKIIKAGYYDNHLTDEEASQFENMITALLTGEQEAIQEMERNKKLEENYKFTWENDNEEVVQGE